MDCTLLVLAFSLNHIWEVFSYSMVKLVVKKRPFVEKKSIFCRPCIRKNRIVILKIIFLLQALLSDFNACCQIEINIGFLINDLL